MFEKNGESRIVDTNTMVVRLDIYMCVATISGAVQFVTCFVCLFVAAYSCAMLVTLNVVKYVYLHLVLAVSLPSPFK